MGLTLFVPLVATADDTWARVLEMGCDAAGFAAGLAVAAAYQKGMRAVGIEPPRWKVADIAWAVGFAVVLPLNLGLWLLIRPGGPLHSLNP